MSSSEADRFLLAQLLTTDPGLPRPNPTNSHWLSPPHQLASTQSQILPAETDIVVIGSGITGASVAWHLLNTNPHRHVTLLEARSLCSAATGRNGGHLVTYGGLIYSDLEAMVGKDMAGKIVKYTYRNVETVEKLAAEVAAEESQIRSVTRVRTFEDEFTFEKAKKSVEEFEKDYPDLKGKYTFIDAQTALKDHGVHGIVGAVLFQAAAMWPYRLIMKVYEMLLKKHPSRLSIEAYTPVTSVSHTAEDNKSRPYILNTPRGSLKSSQVVYCTNGYSAHLLPKLRGKLFPYRGTMTVQDLGNTVPKKGHEFSWSIHHKPRYDAGSKATSSGTWYLQQNHLSGHFFFGGEKKTALEALNSDDTTACSRSIKELHSKLISFFGKKENDSQRVVSTWSGIMGFTADDMPLVGKLSSPITQRDGNGEWIAAGFNGMGMSLCWLAGQAIAKMIGNEDISDWFPEAFQPTEERLESRLALENGIEGMAHYFPHAAESNAKALL